MTAAAGQVRQLLEAEQTLTQDERAMSRRGAAEGGTGRQGCGQGRGWPRAPWLSLHPRGALGKHPCPVPLRGSRTGVRPTAPVRHEVEVLPGPNVGAAFEILGPGCRQAPHILRPGQSDVKAAMPSWTVGL